MSSHSGRLHVFSRSAAYRRFQPALQPPGTTDFPFTERHLQCVWFDDALRPANLKTEQGDHVVVEHPGQWNLEAGPDFFGATLRVGPEQRRIAGDVEIHVHPADWQRHGHADDPAYARVIAHITFFPGYVTSASLPAGAIQISLKDGLAANPCFCFESLDLTAYPFAARMPSTPCARHLQAWESPRLGALFEAAGEERLRRKAERLAGAVAAKGADQTFYEELFGALGYKNNRIPFRKLAELLPFEALRETAECDPVKAYALLMGVAGLLPAQTMARWDSTTRAFVRRLWNVWWKHRSQWSSRSLKRADWVLHGLRPQNHPQRRLMAAALLCTQEPALPRRLMAMQADPAEACLEQVMALLQPAAETYWQHRLAFGGKPQAAPTTLMGARRAAAVVVNVVIPFLAALGNPQVVRSEFLQKLPPEEDNHIVRQTAHNLLGPDHNPALYRSGLRQQGLIQIFHDFCLNDRSRCRDCVLLKSLSEAFHEH